MLRQYLIKVSWMREYLIEGWADNTIFAYLSIQLLHFYLCSSKDVGAVYEVG